VNTDHGTTVSSLTVVQLKVWRKLSFLLMFGSGLAALGGYIAKSEFGGSWVCGVRVHCAFF